MRRRITDLVEDFCYSYPLACVLITSRTVGYRQAPLRESLFEPLELDEFDDPQVALYVQKWEQYIAEDSREVGAIRQQSFMEESKTVRDLRRNPLLLSLMCAMYRGPGTLPVKRADIYEQCSTLLFIQWDRHRGLQAPSPFHDVIDEVIQFIAHWMLVTVQDEYEVTRTRLIREITTYSHGRHFRSEEAAYRAATDFVDYCRGRLWLLTEVGSTAEEGVFKTRFMISWLTGSGK
jgi:predicted NACHT family NTPase